MKFQTEIPLQAAENPINYQSKLLLVGSCFSEHIGDKLSYFKFQTTQNPFGILFHPKAIETLISRAIDLEQYTDAEVFFHNDRWHCYDAHSTLSDASKETLLSQLNSSLSTTRQDLEDATHMVITLGTAWVYILNESGNVVANCHKVPQREFTKKLLSIRAVVESLQNMISLIRSVNATVEIIFTVSPVRHLKDGFVENQRSKAHLIAAVHDVISHDSQRSHYFPSYEIMMDELRDYRFYATDMIHPSTLAIDHIWSRFGHAWISEAVQDTMKDVEAIQKGMSHKPFHPDGEQHQQFLRQLEERERELRQAYPHMKF